jgi:hypothetical protein
MHRVRALGGRRRIGPADKGCTGSRGCRRRAGAAADSAVVLRAGGSADGFDESIDALADSILVERDGRVVEAMVLKEERRLRPREQNKKRRTKDLGAAASAGASPHHRQLAQLLSLCAHGNPRECKMQLLALRPAHHIALYRHEPVAG